MDDWCLTVVLMEANGGKHAFYKYWRNIDYADGKKCNFHITSNHVQIQPRVDNKHARKG